MVSILQNEVVVGWFSKSQMTVAFLQSGNIYTATFVTQLGIQLHKQAIASSQARNFCSFRTLRSLE